MLVFVQRFVEATNNDTVTSYIIVTEHKLFYILITVSVPCQNSPRHTKFQNRPLEIQETSTGHRKSPNMFVPVLLLKTDECREFHTNALTFSTYNIMNERIKKYT